MTDMHTVATRIAASTLQPVPQRAFRLVCGHCGGNIALDSGSLARDVRCPTCSHRVKVGRSVSRTCEYCGTQSSVDPTNGSMPATCGDGGRAYTAGPVMTRVLRRHQHGHRRSHPCSSADPGAGVAVALIGASLALLYILVQVSLGLYGSRG